MNPKIKGVALGAAAAASYGLNPSFALPLYADGLDPDSVLFLRYGMAIPIVALMIVLRGRSFRIPKGSIIPLVILGLLMSLSSLTLFVSYNYMDAGIASTILFVYPILVAVIMCIFYEEKLTWRKISCILMATTGVFMLYHTGESGTQSLVGTLIVISSALCYALYLVGVNHRRVESVPTLTATFYVLCVGFFLFAFRLLFRGQPLATPTEWYLWLDAFALAALPTTVSLICTTAAIQLIGSTPTAILGALEPVTAVVMGILFFHEGMSVQEAIGIVLVLVSVSFIIIGNHAHGGRMSRHLTRFRQMFPKLRVKKM